MPPGWRQLVPFLPAIRGRPRWPRRRGWKSSSARPPAFIWSWIISSRVLFAAGTGHQSFCSWLIWLISVSPPQEPQISALPVKSTVLTKRWVRNNPPRFLFSLQKVYLQGNGNAISKYDKDKYLPVDLIRGNDFSGFDFVPSACDGCLVCSAAPVILHATRADLHSGNKSRLLLKVDAKKRSFSALGRRTTTIIILLPSKKFNYATLWWI